MGSLIIDLSKWCCLFVTFSLFIIRDQIPYAAENLRTDHRARHPTTMASVVHALVLAASQPQYKGKLTHRSWPELPEEIIRSVSPYPMPPHAMAAGLMGHLQDHRQLLPT